jgi:hypothetical protein
LLTQLSSRNKDSSKKKAEFWPAFFIFFLIAAVTVCQADEIVSKSPNDEQQYEYFELPNQLKVLIVSDPAADKAAASLDVNIGSASDPTEYQGLAHFLWRSDHPFVTHPQHELTTRDLIATRPNRTR